MVLGEQDAKMDTTRRVHAWTVIREYASRIPDESTRSTSSLPNHSPPYSQTLHSSVTSSVGAQKREMKEGREGRKEEGREGEKLSSGPLRSLSCSLLCPSIHPSAPISWSDREESKRSNGGGKGGERPGF